MVRKPCFVSFENHYSSTKNSLERFGFNKLTKLLEINCTIIFLNKKCLKATLSYGIQYARNFKTFFCLFIREPEGGFGKKGVEKLVTLSLEAHETYL